MNFNIQIEGIEQLKRKLDPQIIKRAMAATLNEMGTAIKTEMAEQITGRYMLTSARTKEGIKIKNKATPSKLTAEVTFIGRTPGLQHFKAKQITTSGVQYSIGKHGIIGRKLKRKKPSMGVSVEIIRGQRKTVRGAFMAFMPKGGTGVWKRLGKNRTPIERKFGPSIKGMFLATAGVKKVQEIVSTKINKSFHRNYERYLYLQRRR